MNLFNAYVQVLGFFSFFINYSMEDGTSVYARTFSCTYCGFFPVFWTTFIKWGWTIMSHKIQQKYIPRL